MVFKTLTFAVVIAVFTTGYAAAQTGANSADKGSKGSRIVGPMPPGSNPSQAKGADNPGGLGRGPDDVPEEPATTGGLPGKRPGDKPASESAGKSDRDSLHGRPRRGTGGASIDQVREPDAKGR